MCVCVCERERERERWGWEGTINYYRDKLRIAILIPYCLLACT
jgi:hypothetical protein